MPRYVRTGEDGESISTSKRCTPVRRWPDSGQRPPHHQPCARFGHGGHSTADPREARAVRSVVESMPRRQSGAHGLFSVRHRRACASARPASTSGEGAVPQRTLVRRQQGRTHARRWQRSLSAWARPIGPAVPGHGIAASGQCPRPDSHSASRRPHRSPRTPEAIASAGQRAHMGPGFIPNLPSLFVGISYTRLSDR